MDSIRLPYCTVPFPHSPTHTRTGTIAIVPTHIYLSTLRAEISVRPGVIEPLAKQEMHTDKCPE
ncbi:MAG TPA: hypothetical protein ENI58_00985 [Nitrospirae bacterium]|nr:hypothetical protein [Nitrospirota bacterium]